jgi:hypothetical protein
MAKKELERLEREPVDELLSEVLIPEHRTLVLAQQYIATANDLLRVRSLHRAYRRLGKSEEARSLEAQLAELTVRLELLESENPGIRTAAREYQEHIHRHRRPEPECRYCMLVI